MFKKLKEYKELITLGLPLLYGLGYIMQTISYGKIQYFGLEFFDIRYLLTGIVTIALIGFPALLFIAMSFNEKSKNILARSVISVFFLIFSTAIFFIIIVNGSGFYEISLLSWEFKNYIFSNGTISLLWNFGTIFFIIVIFQEDIEKWKTFSLAEKALHIFFKFVSVLIIFISTGIVGSFWGYNFFDNNFNLPSGIFTIFIAAWFVIIGALTFVISLYARRIELLFNDKEDEKSINRIENIFYASVLLLSCLFITIFYIATVFLPLIPRNLGGTEPTYCFITLIDEKIISGYLINDIGFSYYLIRTDDGSTIKLDASQVKLLVYKQ